MEYKYLLMVTENNNNKYYEMIPNGNSFTVKYGRVGASAQVASYPESQFDKKYKEKIRKGYVDQTELRKDLINIEKPKEKKIYKDIDNDSVKQLIEFLQRCARQKIADNYTISSEKVTQAMVDEGQNILNDIANIKDWKAFNALLLKLFNVLPRKMMNVNDYLATSEKDFTSIYTREQDLLNVMRGQVVQHKVDNEVGKDEKEKVEKTILEALGLKIEPVGKTDEKIIRRELGDLKDKYYMAWKVTNKNTDNKFKEHISGSDFQNTKLLWHGSRNENWMSIISNGLILNPNAVITGKLYGRGIYFAPKSNKSFGYTSYNNSYWARGNSDIAIMGLYEVHYGNPYIVGDFNSRYYDFNYTKLREEGNYDCLHAKAGVSLGHSSLRNDEIVVYREDQLNIKYLVELK